jgi:hypothetical protein
MLGKPSLVGLQCIAGWRCGAMVIGGERLHGDDINNFAVCVDERGAEGNLGMLHPQAEPGRLGRDKQHALIYIE